MKYFGFIKEHDNYDYATSIKDLIVDDNIENPHKKEVIDYLKKGELCVPFMGCVENANDPNFNTDDYDDDNFIAYISICTDGKWYWPKYFATYLEKYPTMKIDQDFVNYVLRNKDKEIKLSEEEVKKLERNYFKENWD